MPGYIEVFIFLIPTFQLKLQKQPSRGVQRKRRSENMQQIYRRTPMAECNFYIEIAISHGCSPGNLLQICRIFAQHLSLKILLHGCFWYIDLILSLPLLHSSNFITLPLIVTKNANKVKYWHVFHILAIASTLVNLILLWCFIAPTRRNKCWTLNFIFCWLTLKLLNCSRFQDPTYAFQAHEFV